MLSGWEWIIIGVVALVVIMWGPAKIPELAKALGRAKGEFEKATKEFNEAATEVAKPTVTHPVYTSTTFSPTVPPSANQVTSDDVLIETAKMWGIITEAKTRTQISEEISNKIKAISST